MKNIHQSRPDVIARGLQMFEITAEVSCLTDNHDFFISLQTIA